MYCCKRIPIPYVDGEMVPVYIPKGGIYNGVNTEHNTHGMYCDVWIPNDFSVCRDGDTFHMVGITQPRVPGFINGYQYATVAHEGEYQLFHCSAKANSFSELLKPDSFHEEEKILYPAERPGEGPEIWAPQLLKDGDEFAVIYSPRCIRSKRTKDFRNWKETEILFTCSHASARDPMVFEEDGVYHLIYTENRCLMMRDSTDLHHFSDPIVLQESLFENTENESPFLFKRKGFYYLLWSIWDTRNGSYDDRTMVFASETLTGFGKSAPVTMLRAHAPEVVTDPDGSTYLLSVFSPHNGVSAAKLSWLE